MIELPAPRAGFLAGQLYTTLLPDSVRKRLGAFYTPPPLVDRLLEMATLAGFDWRRGRIVDPACGGAAFLSAIAPRLVDASCGKSPSEVLSDIEARLMGLEVDPFAAWMAMVLLDMALLMPSVRAGRRPRPLILTTDAFDVALDTLGQFDLVVGNPPYGKVTLPPSLRERFSGSLFGHANLYGLFTELGARLAREGGLLAYVTPTSFLGGEYFKKLRGLLCSQAPLLQVDFVHNRQGVFEGVLQETMLTVFARRAPSRSSRVHVGILRADNDGEAPRSEEVAKVAIRQTDGTPWTLPRAREQAPLVRQLNAMPLRLTDYGFAVATGQLVWNRHKQQLCASAGPGCYPIVWAEAVCANGVFQFQAARRNHLPYFRVHADQHFLINREPCVLVQRTTAKEQPRRLIAAVIPNSFILDYPGFAVENHLNMVFPVRARPPVALSTLAALLNSRTLDLAFRCISGSVAVSAYELNSLPMPDMEQVQALQHAMMADASWDEVEECIAGFYLPTRERHEHIAPRHSSRHPHEMVA